MKLDEQIAWVERQIEQRFVVLTFKYKMGDVSLDEGRAELKALEDILTTLRACKQGGWLP